MVCAARYDDLFPSELIQRGSYCRVTRHLPLFDTVIVSAKLLEAHHEFWLEQNEFDYTKVKLMGNVIP